MESHSVPLIVCYLGGTCGDLITAMIDPTGAELHGNRVSLWLDRARLKKPHLFADNSAKDHYLQEMSGIYQSVPSHDFDYHRCREHSFVTVKAETWTGALWAADRFRRLHRQKVWDEMQAKCGASTVEDYANIIMHFSKSLGANATNVVTLEAIMQGQAVKQLSNCLSYNLTPQGIDFYHQWLEHQTQL